MKNNSGFTLIELLAVIVILGVIMVIGTSSVLPLMGEAREKTFRLTATNVIKDSIDSKDLYSTGILSIENDNDSCVNVSTKKMCFTINKLSSVKGSDLNENGYYGKVEIINYTDNNPTYKLYLRRGFEFRIVGEEFTDYTRNGTIDSTNWEDSFETCSCE